MDKYAKLTSEERKQVRLELIKALVEFRREHREREAKIKYLRRRLKAYQAQQYGAEHAEACTADIDDHQTTLALFLGTIHNYEATMRRFM